VVRALLLIELELADPRDIVDSIEAVHPHTIPHYAGSMRITIDGFGDETPATRIVEYLDGRE
jgi:hypothetical protein